MKVLSFLLDVCPIIGGLKMMREGIKGKDMTGEILIGNARAMQFLFGLISLILDCFTIGTIGSLARGTLRIVTLGLFKRSASNAVQNTLGKGFIKRGLMGAARRVGKGGVRRELARAGLVVGKIAEKKVLGVSVGRFAVSAAENKIRKTVKNKASEFYGARVDKKKRKELFQKYGISSREDVINAQKSLKENEKDDHDIALQKDMKKEFDGLTLRGAFLEGAKIAGNGTTLRKSLSDTGHEIGKQQKNSFVKRHAIKYLENKLKKKALNKYDDFMNKKAKERAIILEAQRQQKEVRGSRNN